MSGLYHLVKAYLQRGWNEALTYFYFGSPLGAILFQSASLMWWGVVFLIRGESAASGHLFRFMLAFLGPYAWGILFVGSALAGLVGCVMGCGKTTKISALVTTGLWAFVFGTYAIQSVITTGTGIYLLYILLSIWVYWRGGKCV